MPRTTHATWRTDTSRTGTGRQGVTTIQARPALYRGIRMRSRLEADYAAHLDQWGARWEYEPECFAGAAGQWLPDFGISFADDGPLRIFTEVKPAGPLQALGRELDGGYYEHADAILRRMAVAWESMPSA